MAIWQGLPGCRMRWLITGRKELAAQIFQPLQGCPREEKFSISLMRVPDQSGRRRQWAASVHRARCSKCSPSSSPACWDALCPDHPLLPWSCGASASQIPGRCRVWHGGSQLSICRWQEQSQLSQRGLLREEDIPQPPPAGTWHPGPQQAAVAATEVRQGRAEGEKVWLRPLQLVPTPWYPKAGDLHVQELT